jgi:CRISPR-associated protein Cas6/Cse3/CasE subtype I-E
LAWLGRKAEQNGFRVLHADEVQEDKLSAVHPTEQGGRLYLDAYRYTGVLQITEEESFRTAVQRGIGPSLAYGLGMLLLKS